MARSKTLLGRIKLTLTQAGMDSAIEDSIGKISVPIKWEKDIGVLGSLHVSGKIVIQDVKLRMAGNVVHTGAKISPAMKITHKRKLTGKHDAALDFSVAPVIDAALHSEGSKALVVLQLPQVKLDEPHWPGILDEVAKALRALIGSIETKITELVNARLEKHPIEVIDLNDFKIPVPKGKKLDALLDFTTLEFKGSKLYVGVEVKS